MNRLVHYFPVLMGLSLALLCITGCGGPGPDDNDALARMLKSFESLDAEEFNRVLSDTSGFVPDLGKDGIDFHRRPLQSWAQPTDGGVVEMLEGIEAGTRFDNLMIREKARGYVRAYMSNKSVEALKNIDPYSSSPLFMLELAEVYGVAFDFDNAIAALEKAVSLSDRPYYANMCIQNIHSINNRYQKTRKAAQKAAEINPSVPYTYYRIGRSCFITGDYDCAIGAFKKIENLHPKSIVQLGVLYFELGKYQEAKKYFEKLSEKFPGHEMAIPTMARNYLALGEYETVRKMLMEEILRRPENELAFMLLGQTLLLMEQPQAALAYLDNALELNPNNKQAHKIKAQCYAALGKMDEAEKESRFLH